MVDHLFWWSLILVLRFVISEGDRIVDRHKNVIPSFGANDIPIGDLHIHGIIYNGKHRHGDHSSDRHIYGVSCHGEIDDWINDLVGLVL